MEIDKPPNVMPSPSLRAWRAFVQEMRNERAAMEDQERTRATLWSWSWRRLIYFLGIGAVIYLGFEMVRAMNEDGWVVPAVLGGLFGSRYMMRKGNAFRR